MMLYLEFFKKAFQERYAYKFDFYVSLIGNLLTIIVQISIWIALYQSNIDKPISISEMISYVILSSFVASLTNSQVSQKLGEKVENGHIIMDFIKPINLKNYLFAEDLGRNIFQVASSTFPSILLISLIYGFDIPAEIKTWAIFSVSLILGILIAFYFHYIIGLFVFWLETSWYITFYVGALMQLFSGSIVPLWFYPEWLFIISNALPFRLIFFEPIAIFLEQRTGYETLQIIAIQLFWLLILYLLERTIWSFATNKVVTHGG